MNYLLFIMFFILIQRGLGVFVLVGLSYFILRESWFLFKNQVVSEEVDRLLEAGFIKEVEYADWISNVVVVGKKNGKWRMCVDFINLNKACPKDDYPVPKIDQKVDATAGYELLSFLDAYSGYNQIPLLESDQLKTCFICERGLYCYRVMPFGLKNAGATYQRLVNKMFKRQIGRTMEVYIDDMVVKRILERRIKTQLFYPLPTDGAKRCSGFPYTLRLTMHSPPRIFCVALTSP